MHCAKFIFGYATPISYLIKCGREKWICSHYRIQDDEKVGWWKIQLSSCQESLCLCYCKTARLLRKPNSRKQEICSIKGIRSSLERIRIPCWGNGRILIEGRAEKDRGVLLLFVNCTTIFNIRILSPQGILLLYGKITREVISCVGGESWVF